RLIQRVCHIEDMCLGFAGRVLQRHLRDRRGVVEHLALNGDRVLRHHGGFIDFTANSRPRSRDSAASPATAAGGGLRCGGGGRRRSLRSLLGALTTLTPDGNLRREKHHNKWREA